MIPGRSKTALSLLQCAKGYGAHPAAHLVSNGVKEQLGHEAGLSCPSSAQVKKNCAIPLLSHT
jgi:hypothetical protein